MQDAIVLIGIVLVSAPIIIAAGYLRVVIRRKVFGLAWRPLERLRHSDDDTPISAIFSERYHGATPEGADSTARDDVDISAEDNSSARVTRILRRLLWGVRAPSPSAPSNDRDQRR